MLDNQTLNDTTYLRIIDGMTVYARNGDKLGTVRGYSPQSGYIDVHKGWFFMKDFYVPMNEIDTVAEDGVTLKLEKEALDGDRYTMPPVDESSTPDPITLADGSVMNAHAVKQPLDMDNGDVMMQPKDVEMGIDGPDIADQLRTEQPYRVR